MQVSKAENLALNISSGMPLENLTDEELKLLKSDLPILYRYVKRELNKQRKSTRQGEYK